ncbi:hypothetical protein C9218_25170, partial [Escherichia coli]
KTCIFSHPVYLFLREFSLQDSRGGSVRSTQHVVSLRFLHHKGNTHAEQRGLLHDKANAPARCVYC